MQSVAVEKEDRNGHHPASPLDPWRADPPADRWRSAFWGGPPPHIHTREDETFYVLQGDLEFLLGDQIVTAGPGDFVNVPRGTVHRFQNTGAETARIILTFTPAGIEHWFEETLERAPNEVRADEVPDNVDEVGARYAAAAPRYGIEFVTD